MHTFLFTDRDAADAEVAYWEGQEGWSVTLRQLFDGRYAVLVTWD